MGCDDKTKQKRRLPGAQGASGLRHHPPRGAPVALAHRIPTTGRTAGGAEVKGDPIFVVDHTNVAFRDVGFGLGMYGMEWYG